MLNLPIFFTAIGSVFLNAMAQITLRKAMIEVGPPPDSAKDIISFALSLATTPAFILGMSCYAISIGVWLFILSKLEVSLAYPLLSVGYIFAAVVGYYYLGENVTVTRMAGIFIICVGVVVLSRSA